MTKSKTRKVKGWLCRDGGRHGKISFFWWPRRGSPCEWDDDIQTWGRQFCYNPEQNWWTPKEWAATHDFDPPARGTCVRATLEVDCYEDDGDDD